MKLYLWLFAITFFVHENTYFGWNLFPKSDAELIADGIALLLSSMAMLASTNKIIVNVTQVDTKPTTKKE